jgi:hypothetical protein
VATVIEGNDRTAAAPTARPPAARRPAAWPWWLLRAGVGVQALATFGQPLFAGRFLAGDYGSLAAHRAGAVLVLDLSFVQLVTALLAWKWGRAPGGLILTAVAMTTAVTIQLHAGFSHDLGLHIPLGVLVVGVTAWLLVWTWRHGPDRTGGGRGRAADTARDSTGEES